MIERYTRPAMAGIWELESKFRIWLDIEIAVCEAQSRRGIVPPGDLAIIREKADFSVDRILEIENQVHHDVIAFLTAVAEKVGPSSRYIHYGLTSSDIGDTAFSIQLIRAGKILLEGVDALMGALKEKALQYRLTPCMGRSHGVHAEPTTFGLKMALYHEEFKRNRERIARAIAGVSFGKFSGAVGTFSNIDPTIELEVCRALGLSPDPISTQVIQRDRHAEYMAAMAITAGTLDQLATEIRHLQRTEVREAEEPFQKGQKGSSAMPHKRNPILCERVTGLSRVIKANLNVALDDMTLWHERDISHSSAERVIFPDSTMALDYLLHRMTFIITDLIVYPENMQQNINRSGGLFFSQTFLLALVEKGMTREDSYALVQELAMRVWRGEGDLRGLASKEPRVMDLLEEKDMDGIFLIDRYLEHVDFIFEKTGLR